MKKLQYLLVIALLFSACSKATSEESEESEEIGVSGAFYRTSYIYTFVVPSELNIISYHASGYSGYIIVSMSGDKYHYKSEKHTEYAELYGDTYYNWSAVPYGITAYTEQFDYINVTCQTDFNATYPAGALLNEIVNISFTHYYDYVHNGYSGGGVSPCTPYTRIDALISEVNNVGYKLVETDFSFELNFNEAPTEEGEHTFDIELKMGDTILTGEVTKEF